MFGKIFLILFCSMYLAGPAAAADNRDRHAGYYYPEAVTHETYKARAKVLKEANRQRRIGFVMGVVAGQQEQPYPPQAAMFAKGEEAEKLIIISLVDGRMDTIYRGRAMLATLTAAARAMPIFQEMRVATLFTFLDLCKMLGFKQITISNGRDFAHQIKLE